MTANADKGADGRSDQQSDTEGGQAKKKTSAAAKPSGDEVTVKTGDLSEADKTKVDVDSANTSLSDKTMQDIRIPGSSERVASKTTTGEDATDTYDAASWRRGLDATSTDLPTDGESAGTSGRSPAMDVSSGPGFGSATPPGDPARAQSGTDALQKPSKAGGRLAGALRKPAGGGKAPRKAHLQVARLEPWSVMKFSFVMSLVSFVVLFVAVVVLYLLLSWLGVFDAVSNTIRDLTSNDQGKSGSINPASWFSAARVLSYTALIGILNVLLITALATVWSVIYNLAADFVGGVEVTLKEADQ